MMYVDRAARDKQRARKRQFRDRRDEAPPHSRINAFRLETAKMANAMGLRFKDSIGRLSWF